MLEIAVQVDTDKEDVSEIEDSLDVMINGSAGTNVKEYNIENSYEFDC